LNYSQQLPVTWTSLLRHPLAWRGERWRIRRMAPRAVDSSISNANACFITTNKASIGRQHRTDLGCNRSRPQNPRSFTPTTAVTGICMRHDSGPDFFPGWLGRQRRFNYFLHCARLRGPHLDRKEWQRPAVFNYSGASFRSANITEADALALARPSRRNLSTLFIWAANQLQHRRHVPLDGPAANWVRVNDNAHQYGGRGNAGIIEGTRTSVAACT